VAKARLEWTCCHGDCHGGNAHNLTEGPRAGEAAFFDFDDGRPGYLAYDLAVFLWAYVSFGRKQHPKWHAFVEGYRSVRTLTDATLDSAHLFVLIRHMWLLGEYAGRMMEWGNRSVPAEWISDQLEFMQNWERTKIDDGLL
jgi:Ser/Thr protein kinase RdoA (MazF antagonist)